MRTNTFCRLAGVILLTVAGWGMLVTEGAYAQTPPPSGGITFSPNSDDVDIPVRGVTSGPCDVGASNAFQVYVTGPGSFAPNEATGRPFGVTFLGASTDGFSKTAPITFSARSSFKAFAHELGLTAVPAGVYTVDFRCVDELYLTVFQTYRGTITIAATPSAPSDSPAQTHPIASTGTRSGFGAQVGLMFLGGSVLLAAGVVLFIWLQRRGRRP